MKPVSKKSAIKAVNRAIAIYGGTKAKFAQEIGVKPQTLHTWVIGTKPVPAARALTIERLTGVPRTDLCPSFPWGDV